LTPQATASRSWAHTLLGAAQRQGIAPEALLAYAGVPARQLQEERWPIDHITRLWRAAADLTQDRSFGLQAGSLVGPASFNVVSFLLQSCANLREAIAQVQKFQRLISDGGRFQILAGERASWVIYHPQQGLLAFSPHQIEAVLAAVVRFSQWITGNRFEAQRVQFGHAALGPRRRYESVLGCPVEFEQAFNGLLLDNSVLDEPLPQADAQLALVHRQYADERLAALSDSASLIGSLRAWLAAHMSTQVPGRAIAAQALALSERTLARRLQEHQLSYSDVVDALRRDAACEAVAHSLRPFSDIAQSLGFAEASTFNRAFRRWTGGTPGAWRAQASASAH